MKKLLIVANWKSYKTIYEAKVWIDKISEQLKTFPPVDYKKVIVCPSSTILFFLNQAIKNKELPFFLGAQNISKFPQGAYTGEINVDQVKELADYVIIGHSERRKYFAEDDAVLKNKVSLAVSKMLTPIFCVQDENISIPKEIEIVAYEPIFAIGSGKPDNPSEANSVAEKIKNKTGLKYVLYGGSVTAQNVSEFTGMPSIDGVLIGGASLDPIKFWEIVQNA